MKLAGLFVAATVGAALVSPNAVATTVTQTVKVQVTAINQIAVSPGPSLLINSASAGSAPNSVQSSTGTWSITTNQSGWAITGNLTAALPAGLTLTATVTAPAGATSTGPTALSITAVNLVTGVTQLYAANLPITYQLDATAAAGVVASSMAHVTFTMIGGH